MTKGELLEFLEPFTDDIQIYVKDTGAPNIDLQSLRDPCYRIKRGALRLRDESLLEDGEGYVEFEVPV